MTAETKILRAEKRHEFVIAEEPLTVLIEVHKGFRKIKDAWQSYSGGFLWILIRLVC